MTIDVECLDLMKHLRSLNPTYYGKALELREVITGWLNYVPHTFPHYTRHTLEHSEQIILQLSKILFHEHAPIVDLSSAETYILIAAAYLHDAGMVCSDDEKQSILELEDWKLWTTGDGQAARRWSLIQELRTDPTISSQDTRNFLADVQTRYLLAEYIRRYHHERAADVILQHQQTLGRFAFDDDTLARTISDICVAHGLPRESLDDQLRFPTLRQIRGDDTNVRLLAILLRLGDLLDLDSSRACPLLLSAACPLPSESHAHWNQYKCITHVAISPDRIEIRAECQKPDEHRVLRDWCRWIEDEVHQAPALLARAIRHPKWSPPFASTTGADPTIDIRPGPTAKYYFRDWRFELDEVAVLKRLVSDIYHTPLSFVRELIQNALDAMRCQMYEELRNQGSEPPASPTAVPQGTRDRFVLIINAYEEEILDEVDGRAVKRLVIEFEDCGLGMDENVVTQHFLQVGRSYYTTADFRQRYSFTPSGRFGIGFLSVFNVSEHVIVETFRSSSLQPRALKLTLTGPRNYIVVEESKRRNAGTKILVRLNSDIRVEPGQLTKLIQGLCPRVEFPIIVNDFGVRTEIRAETSADFVFCVPDARAAGDTFVLRDFGVKTEGVEGEIYVLANRHVDGTEDWTQRFWYNHEYLTNYPQVEFKPLPDSLTSFHGIAAGGDYYDGSFNFRLDVRSFSARLDLSRMRHVQVGRKGHRGSLPDGVSRRLAEIVTEHLAQYPAAQGYEGWRYRNKLAKEFPIHGFWSKRKDMIPILEHGVPSLTSSDDLAPRSNVTLIVPTTVDRWNWRLGDALAYPEPTALASIPVALYYHDFEQLAGYLSGVEIFELREVVRCHPVNERFLAIEWSTIATRERERSGLRKVQTSDFEPETLIALFIEYRSLPGGLLVNKRNELGRWYLRVRDALATRQVPFDQRTIEALDQLMEDTTRYTINHLRFFQQHLTGWSSISGLEEDLKPPSLSLNAEMFVSIGDPS